MAGASGLDGAPKYDLPRARGDERRALGGHDVLALVDVALAAGAEARVLAAEGPRDPVIGKTPPFADTAGVVTTGSGSGAGLTFFLRSVSGNRVRSLASNGLPNLSTARSSAT